MYLHGSSTEFLGWTQVPLETSHNPWCHTIASPWRHTCRRSSCSLGSPGPPGPAGAASLLKWRGEWPYDGVVHTLTNIVTCTCILFRLLNCCCAGLYRPLIWCTYSLCTYRDILLKHGHLVARSLMGGREGVPQKWSLPSMTPPLLHTRHYGYQQRNCFHITTNQPLAVTTVTCLAL